MTHRRKSQKRKRFLMTQIIEQRKWIENCEGNGKSYADGERGERIRHADLDHLHTLQDELATYGELFGC